MLRLIPNGLKITSRSKPGSDYYGRKADDLVRFEAVRADARIKDVYIDNIDHGSDPHEQEITVVLSEGTCLTSEIMHHASGVAPMPYHLYDRPAPYDLQFVMRARYPTDQRIIFLGGRSPCYSTVVLKKFFKDE